MIPAGTRAVFFDAVGTLVFPQPSAPVVYADFARRHGADLDPAVVLQRFVAAFRDEERVDRKAGWATSEGREVERWQRIVAATLPELPDPAACFRELYDHYSRPEAWRPNPDAAAVFAQLQRRGLTLGIASNYDRRLPPVLAGLPDLAPARDYVVVSSMVGWRKPAAGFFAAAVARTGFRADEVLMVGDDLENDYQGATAAGLRAILLDARSRFGHVEHRVARLAELVG